MPAIYLRHDLHGQKVAVNDAEADADKALGWVEFDPYEATRIVKTEEQTEHVPKRRGRPPNNRNQ